MTGQRGEPQTPIVGPTDVTIESYMSTVVYVVGNQTLPETPTTPPVAAAATAVTPSLTG